MKYTKQGKVVVKQGAKRPAAKKYYVHKVAGTVSFGSEKLSSQKTVSKSRERYISDISSTAMSAISN